MCLVRGYDIVCVELSCVSQVKPSQVYKDNRLDVLQKAKKPALPTLAGRRPYSHFKIDNIPIGFWLRELGSLQT